MRVADAESAALEKRRKEALVRIAAASDKYRAYAGPRKIAHT